jgi:maltooligosyltrehalose trehalohydrolase
VTAEPLGATVLVDGRCRFVVWAPEADHVEVLLLDDGRRVPLEPCGEGYHRGEDADARAGARYVYALDGDRRLPDPASRWQPEGVHGPSCVDDPAAFAWTDEGWACRSLDEFVIYELHVGAFSPAGTFDAAAERLRELTDLGATAVEVMPVGAFPGDRDWGYDGVFPSAVQASYGGPDGFRRFIDACHAEGLAVVLDVVYNHVGPEGNVLGAFGPYFTDRYQIPWGTAVNFDGPESDEVRRYFIGNARMWFEDFHVDALRLDAIQGIVDTSAEPFLAELSGHVAELSRALDRPLYLIGETDMNDARVVAPRDAGGLGLDAQWTDDLHHGVHALLTGERGGHYGDFGSLDDLATALRQGWTYDGRRSRVRRRRHGSSPRGLPGERFVVYAQNHDQVGNRARGERLSDLLDFEGQKLASAAVLLSPFVPLLFMGEEYGETAPFPYFVSYTDQRIAEVVRMGRSRDLAHFAWNGDDAPDPQAEETFLAAKLDPQLRHKEPHRTLLALYQELLRLRREVPALRRLRPDESSVQVDERSRAIVMHRTAREGPAVVVLAFGDEPAEVATDLLGRWRLLLDTADPRWGGPADRGPAVADLVPGSRVRAAPRSALVYAQEHAG